LATAIECCEGGVDPPGFVKVFIDTSIGKINIHNIWFFIFKKMK